MPNHYPANAAEIIDAINTTSASGDTIYLPCGTHDCTAATLAPKAGVTILGPGNDRCTLRARWQTNLADGTLVMRDFRMDVAALAGFTFGPLEFRRGTFLFTRLRVSGPATAGSSSGNNFTFLATSAGPVKVVLRQCVSHDSLHDAFSVFNEETAENHSAASYVVLVGCEAYNYGYGGASSDNAITTHDGIVLWDFGGYYHSPMPGVDYGINIGTDKSGAYSPLHLIGTKVVGTRVICNSVIRCLIDASAMAGLGYVLSLVGPGAARMLGSKVIAGNPSGAMMSNGVECRAPNSRIEYNFVDCPGSMTAAIALKADAYGTVYVANNRVRVLNGATIGVYVNRHATEPKTIVLKNNLLREVTQSSTTAYGTGAAVTWDGGYNILHATHWEYAAQGTDIKATAEIEADMTPTQHGNCDRNGDWTLATSSPTDLWGRPVLPSCPRSRGPVERATDAAGLLAYTGPLTADAMAAAVDASATATAVAAVRSKLPAGGAPMHAAGAAVAKSPATVDWQNDVTNKPTIPTAQHIVDAMDSESELLGQIGEGVAAVLGSVPENFRALDISENGKVYLRTNAITSGVVDTDAIGASEVSAAACNKIAAAVRARIVGPGSVPTTILCQIDGLPVDGVEVLVSTDAAKANIIAGPQFSDALGKAYFTLDPGDYFVWRQRAPANLANPQPLTVEPNG